MNDLRRCALLVGLVLTVGSQPAIAQRSACFVIQSGDTAASLARRFAGDADHRHQSWFQIFDPAAAKFIAKARYEHIRPGWIACISYGPGAAPETRARIVTSEPVPSTLSGLGPRLAGVRLDVRWCLVLLLLATPLAWRIAERHWKERQAIIEEMTQFGETFIREFERPLVETRISAPSLRARLRCKPHRGRVEVLIAPGAGRTYPNLTDHRKNVEYDMERVLQELHDRRFVSDSLHQQGEWVVVPFQVKARQKMEGIA